MPATQTLFTITGPDRPALLDDLAGAIAFNDGNIVDMRSIELGGQFAIIVMVETDNGAAKAIADALHDLAKRNGLHWSTTAATAPRDENATFGYTLSASGQDRAGIVKKISHLMKVLSVNIDHVDTHTDVTGQILLSMRLDVPRDIPVNKVREFLGQLFGEISLQWELNEIDTRAAGK